MKRNKVKGKYNPGKAQHKAYVRRHEAKYQGMKIVENPKLKEFVEKKLYDNQSPVNIAGRIKKHEKQLKSVSKDSIYRFIKSPYGRRVEYHRTKRKKRRKRKSRSTSAKLKERTFIDKRPEFINKRKRIGDVEADFIVSGRSGKGIILVVVDRRSRTPFLEKINKVTIKNVHLSFQKIKKRFPELKTMTTDNDLLFKKHKELERLLKVKIYFCHPYHSWEKGTVENMNKYIREDIPKGSNISKYSKSFIHLIELKLGRRIMKCLDYQTPVEVLERFKKQKKRLRAERKKKPNLSD